MRGPRNALEQPLLIVIGASAGALDVVRQVVGALSANIPAAVCVVMHVAPYEVSHLPEILGRASALGASHARDGEPLEAGHIYVAPPDHHLLVDGDRLTINRGPKENRFRPSVDALFRSAAYTRGPSVIGVILSGSLDDGASGLWTVRRLGGRTIVQDPSDALFPQMPRNALRVSDVQHIALGSEIGPLLTRLVAEPIATEVTPLSDAEQKRLAIEVEIVARDRGKSMAILNHGALAPITCPDCHGVLVRLDEGKHFRFRCHTGHAYSPHSLLAAVSESVEDALWETLRAMEEGVLLLDELGRHLESDGHADQAAALFARARATEARSKRLHDATLDRELGSEIAERVVDQRS